MDPKEKALRSGDVAATKQNDATDSQQQFDNRMIPQLRKQRPRKISGQANSIRKNLINSNDLSAPIDISQQWLIETSDGVLIGARLSRLIHAMPYERSCSALLSEGSSLVAYAEHAWVLARVQAFISSTTEAIWADDFQEPPVVYPGWGSLRDVRLSLRGTAVQFTEALNTVQAFLLSTLGACLLNTRVRLYKSNQAHLANAVALAEKQSFIDSIQEPFGKLTAFLRAEKDFDAAAAALRGDALWIGPEESAA